MSKNFDLLLKMLMIGDSGVGKSCLLLRFCDASFTPSFITTIGIDFKVKTIVLNGKRIKLQIWDTAGQERFRTITTAYYRGAQGILLVYDVTDERSFLNIRTWMRNIETHSSGDIEKILVANKVDLKDERVISSERGQKLADEYGIKFVEASAKNDINVKDAFVEMATAIIAQRVGGVDCMPPTTTSAALNTKALRVKTRKMSTASVDRAKKCSCVIL
eukprot:CAMPEP_0202689270 /NCGR_PEP_ID=MMETSP1385-20130828/4571_1 /ASSEMBLY_ACC=CAM_ASM_000861 /TAXON_ID=933848 /ORGANISM="Elphidium margaritaceum" /LENGTH=217 /DNA_ID=CAMNT_0049344381 /DNA_START=59 /DNA_END=712 /DNA_ORIENTATION=-